MIITDIEDIGRIMIAIIIGTIAIVIIHGAMIDATIHTGADHTGGNSLIYKR